MSENIELLRQALELSKYVAAPFFSKKERKRTGDEVTYIHPTTEEWWDGLREMIEAIQPALEVAISRPSEAQPVANFLHDAEADLWTQVGKEYAGEPDVIPLFRTEQPVARVPEASPYDETTMSECMQVLLARTEAAEADAFRYRFLRERNIDAISAGGVFAGKTPDNVVLNGADLDAAIDAESGIRFAPQVPAVSEDAMAMSDALRMDDEGRIDEWCPTARAEGGEAGVDETSDSYLAGWGNGWDKGYAHGAERASDGAALSKERVLELAGPHFFVEESRLGKDFNPHPQYHGSDLSVIAFANDLLAAARDAQAGKEGE